MSDLEKTAAKRSCAPIYCPLGRKDWARRGKACVHVYFPTREDAEKFAEAIAGVKASPNDTEEKP